MSEEFVVSQGISIPRLGLGTFRMPGIECQQAVESALSVGYQHRYCNILECLHWAGIYPI